MESRNSFRVGEWKISDAGWSKQQQTEKTRHVSSGQRADLVSLDLGGNECKIVVRAKMETNPLKSACRPTLKLEIVPGIKVIKPSKHTGNTGEKI